MGMSETQGQSAYAKKKRQEEETSRRESVHSLKVDEAKQRKELRDREKECTAEYTRTQIDQTKHTIEYSDMKKKKLEKLEKKESHDRNMRRAQLAQDERKLRISQECPNADRIKEDKRLADATKRIKRREKEEEKKSRRKPKSARNNNSEKMQEKRKWRS